MNPDNAIEVNNVTKKFKVYLDKGNTMKEKVLFKKRRKYEERQVLDGVSFSVKKGEAIGLIGHNGCGKSTTLKLLTRIMYPDTGTIEMQGRVSSLIELGAGFHPDMSGRENIYINASIFGLNKKEIDERLDDIIAFSELERFIDNPVRTYSSGMYMRLAFAVAINVDADILLIDEILAVGDIGFQTKCFQRLQQIKENGTTIVIVSHSLGQIEQICETSYWIDDGKIKMFGAPKEVHKSYLKEMKRRRLAREGKFLNEDEIEDAEEEAPRDNSSAISEMLDQDKAEAALKEKTEEKASQLPDFCSAETNRVGGNEVIFTDVRIELVSQPGVDQKLFHTGDDLKIVMQYQSNIRGAMGMIGIGIRTYDGRQCFETNSYKQTKKMIHFEEKGVIEVKLDGLPLNTGDFVLDVGMNAEDGKGYDNYWRVKLFKVMGDEREIGITHIDNHWKI
jgi:ABC-2 type transport system ATP-binding protein